MRIRRIAVVLCAVLALSLMGAVPATAAVPRIMVVGDSISQGSSGDWTWRYRLARHLTGVDFVGPRTDLYDRATGRHGSQQYMDARFDRQHAAQWGEALAVAKDRIAADVTSSRADLLLVHLGINDLAWIGSAADAEVALRTFIANARSANPRLRLIFGSVLENDAAGLRDKVIEYNGRLASVAAALTTAASPIHVLGVPAGWNPATDTYDGTHPNPRGEYRIAANYANGLAAHAGIGRPYGAIPDVPLFGAPSWLVTEPGDFQATLAWGPVAGATGYYVWQRDVSAGQDWQQLPFPLTDTTWTAGWLTAGHTWEFRVQPVRVRDLGGYSPVAEVVPTGQFSPERA